MSNLDIIRAWKDEEYRSSLSEAERTALPANPAGLVELSDQDLLGVGGMTGWECALSLLSFITAVTAIASCGPACDKTMNIGTCGVTSVGCC